MQGGIALIFYLDRSEVPDLEQIPSDVLRALVRRAELAGGRYDKLWRYYLGHHDIFAQHREGEVQVAVNYAKYVVDAALGYYLGHSVKYDPNQVDALGRPVDLHALLDCYERQHIAETDVSIGRTMGIMGDCLELCYASSGPNPEPRSARIDPRSGILVCDNTVEHAKLFALVWERRQKLSGERFYFVTVYTDRTCRDFVCGDLSGEAFVPVGEVRYHWFGAVPVIAYTNNDQRQGDFEQILSLIDAYDGLMSSRLTDKRKFVDALLVFFGMTLEEGAETQLAREKFIDGAPLDARAEYIQKTFNESEVQVLADALVREMHKMTMTVDMSDEQFSGNASGQALKLKLLTMQLLVRGKMRSMEEGLRERMALYNHWLTVRGVMTPVDPSQVDVVFTLEMPINESEVVDMVCKLKDIVDDQTLLGLLWFVRDPAEALENIRRQRREERQED
jgi:SPP1 family phage portal protein